MSNNQNFTIPNISNDAAAPDASAVLEALEAGASQWLNESGVEAAPITISGETVTIPISTLPVVSILDSPMPQPPLPIIVTPILPELIFRPLSQLRFEQAEDGAITIKAPSGTDGQFSHLRTINAPDQTLIYFLGDPLGPIKLSDLDIDFENNFAWNAKLDISATEQASDDSPLRPQAYANLEGALRVYAMDNSTTQIMSVNEAGEERLEYETHDIGIRVPLLPGEDVPPLPFDWDWKAYEYSADGNLLRIETQFLTPYSLETGPTGSGRSFEYIEPTAATIHEKVNAAGTRRETWISEDDQRLKTVHHDEGFNFAWEERGVWYDGDGDALLRYTHMDDGGSTYRHYQNGSLTFVERHDGSDDRYKWAHKTVEYLRYDGDTDQPETIMTRTVMDSGNVHRHTEIFDEDGNRLQQSKVLRTEEDELIFSKTKTYRTDEEGSWVYFEQSQKGDGTRMTKTYDKDQLVQHTRYDADYFKLNAELDAGFDIISLLDRPGYQFDPAKSAPTPDAPQSKHSWYFNQKRFDDSGQLEFHEIRYDNGVLHQKDYEDGMLVLKLEQDRLDAKDWQAKSFSYDYDSMEMTRTILMDNGDELVRIFDIG